MTLRIKAWKLCILMGFVFPMAIGIGLHFMEGTMSVLVSPDVIELLSWLFLVMAPIFNLVQTSPVLFDKEARNKEMEI